MKLEKKKLLAARTLNVGVGRIVFNTHRLAEVKEAITKQDIRDLFVNKAILIKPISGRHKVQKRTTRRRSGSIRKRVGQSKRHYVVLTRKLRAYLAELKKKEKITQEAYQKLRQEIRASKFRSKGHMKEHLGGTV